MDVKTGQFGEFYHKITNKNTPNKHQGHSNRGKITTGFLVGFVPELHLRQPVYAIGVNTQGVPESFDFNAVTGIGDSYEQFTPFSEEDSFVYRAKKALPEYICYCYIFKDTLYLSDSKDSNIDLNIDCPEGFPSAHIDSVRLLLKQFPPIPESLVDCNKTIIIKNGI